MTKNNSKYLKSRRRNPSRNEDNKIKPSRGRGTVTYKKRVLNITSRVPASKFNKNRLGLKSGKDLNKSGIKINKIINKNANEKTIQKINEGREIKLFTKHFDARAKIESKHTRSPAKSSLVNLDGVAQVLQTLYTKLRLLTYLMFKVKNYVKVVLSLCNSWFRPNL